MIGDPVVVPSAFVLPSCMVLYRIVLYMLSPLFPILLCNQFVERSVVLLFGMFWFAVPIQNLRYIFFIFPHECCKPFLGNSSVVHSAHELSCPLCRHTNLTPFSS
nr:MAG TPA: hypothetical protein [Caudoviricetes sp.]